MGRPTDFGPGFSYVQLLDLMVAGEVCMSWYHRHRELGGYLKETTFFAEEET